MQDFGKEKQGLEKPCPSREEGSEGETGWTSPPLARTAKFPKAPQGQVRGGALLKHSIYLCPGFASWLVLNLEAFPGEGAAGSKAGSPVGQKLTEASCPSLDLCLGQTSSELKLSPCVQAAVRTPPV